MAANDSGENMTAQARNLAVIIFSDGLPKCNLFLEAQLTAAGSIQPRLAYVLCSSTAMIAPWVTHTLGVSPFMPGFDPDAGLIGEGFPHPDTDQGGFGERFASRRHWLRASLTARSVGIRRAERFAAERAWPYSNGRTRRAKIWTGVC